MAHVPEDAVLTLRALKEHSDDATVLVAAQLLSDALQSTILRVCRSDLTRFEREGLFNEDKGGPAATFSSRIRIAYALGCIGPVTRDGLTSVRKIRNAFAHARKPMSFQTPPIEAMCREMALWEGDPEAQTHADVKWMFVLAATWMHGRIDRYRPIQYRPFDWHKWTAIKPEAKPWPVVYEAFRQKPSGYPSHLWDRDQGPPP